MRIELLTHGKHTRRTGIGRYVHELARYLDQKVDMHLCDLRYLPLSSSISPLRQLPTGIQNHVPGSIVHFPQIAGCAMMLWRPVRPSVATVHDLGPLVWPPELAANAFEDALFRLSLMGLRRMDRIVADSHATASCIVDRVGIADELVSVAYLGVDREAFHRHSSASEALEKEFGVRQQADVHDLLFVGSEAPRKNLATLLNAMAILTETGAPVRLLKVGGAGHPCYRAALQRQVETLGLRESVVLVGEVGEADLPLFYSAADVFVLPSYVEGFGLPALEAMACGTPVVCSSAGALPEVVGDAGLLVDPHDPRGFAEAVVQVWNDRHLRDRLVERGLRRCRLFSWERTAAETIAIYHGLHGSTIAHSKAKTPGDQPHREGHDAWTKGSEAATATGGTSDD